MPSRSDIALPRPGLSEALRPARYHFVDALRGIACAGVLVLHLFYPLLATWVAVLPRWTLKVIALGAGGVEIFFVLSGFVIAHSLREFCPSLSSVGNFIVRRHLRLDPPYWCALVPAFVLGLVARAAASHAPAPGFETLAFNLLYLQNVTHAQQILGVAWTLCLEVQFYLIFIAILWAAAMSRGRRGAEKLSGTPVTAIAATITLSLCSMGLNHSVVHAWAYASWYYFAGGVIAYWAWMDARLRPAFWLFAFFFAAQAARRGIRGDPTAWFGFSTTVVLYSVGRAGHIANWTGGRLIQYMGKVSYSVYLIHLPIIIGIGRLGERRWGSSGGVALLLLTVSLPTCFVCGHFMYRYVEVPTAALSKRFKRRPLVVSLPEWPAIQPSEGCPNLSGGCDHLIPLVDVNDIK